MPVQLFSFIGGTEGPWRIQSLDAILGPSIPKAERLQILSGEQTSPGKTGWVFRGVVSNLRYTHREEKDALALNPSVLDRPEAACAAMILLKKNNAWWELSQDERRAIFEEQS